MYVERKPIVDFVFLPSCTLFVWVIWMEFSQPVYFCIYSGFILAVLSDMSSTTEHLGSLYRFNLIKRFEHFVCFDIYNWSSFATLRTRCYNIFNYNTAKIFPKKNSNVSRVYSLIRPIEPRCPFRMS